MSKTGNHPACDGSEDTILRLRAALALLVKATEPYIEEAAPGEEMDGLWCHRFDSLCEARHTAKAILGGAS